VSRPAYLRRHAFAIAAVLVSVAFVVACGAPATTNQTPTTADQSSGAPAAQSTAIAASTPTPAPVPQLLDACKLLTTEDVVAVIAPGPRVMTSYVALLPTLAFGSGTPIPAPSGVWCNYQSMSGDSFTGLMTLRLCRCNASSAEFDSWVVEPQVGIVRPGQSPLLISGVGERAYLLTSGGGIVFRQSGVDFVLQAFGRNLPDLQQTTGPADPRIGGRPLLPEAELTPKAIALFSAVALKVLGRLAASPPAAPSVVACSAGTPTMTIPAGFSFNNCQEQPGDTSYTWCATGGGGACLALRRQPFGGSHLGNSVVIDVGGKIGYLVAESTSTTVGWYDAGLTWSLRLSGGTQLSKDAIIAVAASVRPELVASAPIRTAPTSVTSTTGLCATTPTVTLPASFTFMNCREQASTATFTWQGGTDGAVALGVLPVGTNVPNPGSTAVDINGNPGTIGPTVNSATIVVWSDSKGAYYASAVGSYFTRDALLAFARSVR
jgi:hypothetical protein